MMDCIFCKIIDKEIPAKILSKTLYSVSILDAFPLAKGHTLVFPKSHCMKLQDLTLEETHDLFNLVHHMTSKVDALTGATLIAIHNGKDAGQEIPHLHIHLVPRRQDDSAGAIHSMFDSTVSLTNDEFEELYRKLKD